MDSKNLFISIVIPARNAQATLELCLKAILSSKNHNFEVVVVDDASDDATSGIAEKFHCVLVKLDRNLGSAVARNKGVEVSRGDIILFIDSDIIIKENTIPLILDDFSSDNELAAVVGMLDEEIPHKNLSSQFFSLRKHYDYLLIDGNLSVLNTAIVAIRKDVFTEIGGFNERYNSTIEDAELGRRLYKLGYKIKLNKKIRVVHLKFHTLMSLLISDFTRAGHFAKLLVRERLLGNISKEKRFGSFRGGSLITVSIVPIIILTFISSFFLRWTTPIFYTCFLIFILSNLEFLRFTGKVVGVSKNFFMPLVIFVDSLVVFTGILFGLASFIRGNKF
ncbi:MAG: glycosyltransferase family 2 protein [bacterium]